MPTYSYRCADCGHSFDIQQSFTDDSLTVCPECGGTLRKVFGNIGVTFSGSGFYRTDSRGGGKSSTGSSEGGATKTDAGGSGAASSAAAAAPTGGSGGSAAKSGGAASS